MRVIFFVLLAVIFCVLAWLSYIPEKSITSKSRYIPAWSGKTVSIKDAQVGDTLIADPDSDEWKWQGHDLLKNCGDVPQGKPIIMNGHCTIKKGDTK